MVETMVESAAQQPGMLVRMTHLSTCDTRQTENQTTGPPLSGFKMVLALTSFSVTFWASFNTTTGWHKCHPV